MPEHLKHIAEYLESCGGMTAVVGKSTLLRLRLVQHVQRDQLQAMAQMPELSLAQAEAQRQARNTRNAETVRLQALSPELDAMLEPFLERARVATHLPVAAVNILTDDMQHTVASQGLDPAAKALGGSPRDWSFCQFVVEDRAPLVIEDTAKSRRVRDLAVVKRWNVKCDIGVPLRTKNNEILGALCAIGLGEGVPALGASELQTLRTLAEEIVTLLETRSATKVLKI